MLMPTSRNLSVTLKKIVEETEVETEVDQKRLNTRKTILWNKTI
jgi:hypothetical protein